MRSRCVCLAVIFGGFLWPCWAFCTTDDLPTVRVWAGADARVYFEIELEEAPRWMMSAESTLTQVFGAPVKVSQSGVENGTWMVHGWCSGLATRTLLSVKGTVPLKPLIGLVSQKSAREVDFQFSCWQAAQHKVHFLGAEQYTSEGWCYADATLSGTDEIAPLEFEYGYPVWRLLLSVVGCGTFMALLIGFLVWQRNLLLRRAAADPAAACFAYYRLRGKIYFAGAVVAAVPALNVDPGDFVGFVTGWDSRLLLIGISMFVMFVPFLTLIVLASMASYPIQTRICGLQVKRSNLFLQGIFAGLLGMVPLCLLSLCVTSILDDMPAHAVIFAFCSAGSFLLSWNLLWLSFRVRHEPLTNCPLRDRVDTLAQKANVALRGTYILTPAIRMFLANAGASNRGNLILTDYLVERLTTREVDAIVGHELAHLRYGHPKEKVRLMVRLLLGGGVLGAGLLGTFGDYPGIDVLRTATSGEAQRMLMLFAGCGMVAFMFGALSRRFEREADIGGVEISGDPEAFITALTKISRLNFLPLQWKKRHELGMTHPSMMRRIELIAARAGITAEKLEALIERAQTGDTYYTIPAAVVDAEKVFSSRARQWIHLRNMGAMFMSFALPPALVALAVVHLDLQGVARWLAYVAGVLLTLAVSVGISGFLSLTGARALRSGMYARLARRGIHPNDWHALFVGISPDDLPRLYEGFYNSDIGFLFAAGDRLCFLGDSMQFSLPRANIVTVELGRARLGWYAGNPALIRWRRNEGQPSEQFCVSSYEICHQNRAAVASGRIIRWLNEWRDMRETGVSIPKEFEELGLPEPVASDGVIFHLERRHLIASILRQLIVSFGVCVLFRLLLSGAETGPGFYAIGASLIAVFFHHLPYMKQGEA